MSILKLIETDAFNFEFVSLLAERESWRKEVYRPVYYLHKWWAKRLGSVLRGIILGSVLPDKKNLEDAFYQQHNFSDIVIFDPFMGSGTTLGEAHKLGCTVLGRDINPVACENVRVCLGQLERNKLLAAFEKLSSSVGERIRALYTSEDAHGKTCDALYFFWVKAVECPNCTSLVDLFSSQIFAGNAYPNRKPEVKIVCPGCDNIITGLYTDKETTCDKCGLEFNPQKGCVRGAKATCHKCHGTFNIAETIRKTNHPPNHRLYAKLLLTPEDEKIYLPATNQDIQAYNECSKTLQEELKKRQIRLPDGHLEDGYNTRQAINYNYRNWRDFFNDRQLLALAWLQADIAQIEDAWTRDAVFNLFSGVLEFNNMFASYKGEGTGAVRHMFSHHILKPERAPIEANVWGTPKSSGSFSNLFRTRLVRALDYRDAPFEVTLNGNGKEHFTSRPFSGNVTTKWPIDGKFEKRAIYLSSGSSHQTGLPDQSIDVVLTDPPFFDNVHYSELADFFYAWQKLYPRGFLEGTDTTRNETEVQDADPQRFSVKLKDVFVECYRVLKDEGLLVFTYHHSRIEGWSSLLRAIIGAGFTIKNAHPVKAEMSVATPKSQTKEPIQIDVILVCRKSIKETTKNGLSDQEMILLTQEKSTEKASRLRRAGFKLSQNDVKVIVFSQFLSSLSVADSDEIAEKILSDNEMHLEKIARQLFSESYGESNTAEASHISQMSLWTS